MNTEEKTQGTGSAVGHSTVSRTRIITGAGMLTAVAAVLQYLNFTIPIMPGFIKFDFSDLPALIGAYAYGPLTGVIIELLKNLIHCAASQSATVGELSNFLLGAVFTLTAGLIYRHNRTKKGALAGGLTGAVAMAALSIPINNYIVYPAYFTIYGLSRETVLGMYQVILPRVQSIFQCLLIFNLPFTLVKGLISVAISMVIYKPLSPLLKGASQN